MPRDRYAAHRRRLGRANRPVRRDLWPVCAPHGKGHVRDTFVNAHLDAVKEVVFRNGTLRANFFRDIWRVEKVRRRFDAKEIQLFREVLREGIAKGVFQIDDLEMTAEIVHYTVKGIEAPYIRGHVGAYLDDETRGAYVSRLVLGALGKK